MGNKAFSLFEFTITIAALFIFIFFSLPKLSFVNDFILRSEVEKLFTTFSYLQERAIASNQEQYLIFDLDNHSYSFFDKNEVNKIVLLPKEVRFGCLQNALGPPANPKKKIKKIISFKKIENSKFKVTFLPDGDISAGSVYLIDKNRTKLVALSSSVSPFACIRTYKYQSNKWISLN